MPRYDALVAQLFHHENSNRYSYLASEASSSGKVYAVLWEALTALAEEAQETISSVYADFLHYCVSQELFNTADFYRYFSQAPKDHLPLIKQAIHARFTLEQLEELKHMAEIYQEDQASTIFENLYAEEDFFDVQLTSLLSNAHWRQSGWFAAVFEQSELKAQLIAGQASENQARQNQVWRNLEIKSSETGESVESLFARFLHYLFQHEMHKSPMFYGLFQAIPEVMYDSVKDRLLEQFGSDITDIMLLLSVKSQRIIHMAI